MKYNLNINQFQALELGITNINQAIIFDLLTTASTWADPEVIDNEVFYWVARQTIVEELKILNLKPDTVYRHLKSLSDIGVIVYKKNGKKDCIKITPKGKKYLSKECDSTMSEINPNHYVGNKSEKESNSEINPKKLGNKSEFDSEINPTYHNTNINHNTNDHNNKKNTKKEFSDLFEKLRKDFDNISPQEILFISNFIHYRKSIKHPIKTIAPIKSFFKELRAIKAAGYDLNSAIELMHEREWRTIKLEWIKNTNGSENKSGFDISGKQYIVEEF